MRFKTFLEEAADKDAVMALAVSKLNKIGTPKKVNAVVYKLIEKFHSSFNYEDVVKVADLIIDSLGIGWMSGTKETGWKFEALQEHPITKSDIIALSLRIPNSTGMVIPAAEIREILLDVFGEPKQTSLFGEANFWTKSFKNMGVPEKLSRICETLYHMIYTLDLAGTPTTICKLIGQDLGLGTIKK